MIDRCTLGSDSVLRNPAVMSSANTTARLLSVRRGRWRRFGRDEYQRDVHRAHGQARPHVHTGIDERADFAS